MLPSTIATTDRHTGGEPFRIVADPPVPIPGPTAHRTGEHPFSMEPHDPPVSGFVLR